MSRVAVLPPLGLGGPGDIPAYLIHSHQLPIELAQVQLAFSQKIDRTNVGGLKARMRPRP